jgi:hypothetical protein
MWGALCGGKTPLLTTPVGALQLVGSPRKDTNRSLELPQQCAQAVGHGELKHQVVAPTKLNVSKNLVTNGV